MLRCALLLGLILLHSPVGWNAHAAGLSAPSAAQAHTARPLSREHLTQALGARITQIPEFEFIRHEAERLGVHAYLFGGTAAGYAHYVKWDLEREAGDPRYQADRFDYDYTNIYRSTQDLDIVVDGPADKAKQLEAALAQKYPHLQGSKSAWEVRLLRETMGDKQALLGNPDFLNQHTDSNSTGMIEITHPSAGEPVVRDLRDWDSHAPHFLKDVHEGSLHYYFSPEHGETEFARSGRNPPIISVIRYLTKAFQYELKLRPEDLAHIKQIIDHFDPLHGPEVKNDYVRHWLLKKDNGRKLIQNAVNIEYAWNTLEQLGLRQKLIAVENNPSTTGSLAWWMSKEPLRSRPLLAADVPSEGKTAAQLATEGQLPKDLIFAHETGTFPAYESITRAHTGDPNVLISRPNTAGEAAAFGDGFYLRQGQEGARKTGLTIRFHLDPDAREGRDFRLAATDFLTVQNKSALRVIPESLHMTAVEYFTRLADGGAAEFKESDRGVLEKFRRRVSRDLRLLSPEERADIGRIVEKAARKWIAEGTRDQLPPVLTEWFSSEPSLESKPLLVRLIESGKANLWIARNILSLPHWENRADLVGHLIHGGGADRYIAEVLLTDPRWKDHPELVESLIRGGRANWHIAWKVLPQPHWQGHPEFVDQLITRENHVDMLKYIFAQPAWKSDVGLLDRLIRNGGVSPLLAKEILSRKQWSDHPELIEKLIRSGKADAEVARSILTKPYWANHPELVSMLIDRGSADREIAEFVLSEPHWANHPELVERLIERGTADEQIARFVLSRHHWKDHPELVDRLIRDRKTEALVAEHVLSKPHWRGHPELVEKLLQGERVDDLLARYVLSREHWASHPEFVKGLIERGRAEPEIARFVMSQPFWQEHPALAHAAGRRPRPPGLCARTFGGLAQKFRGFGR